MKGIDIQALRQTLRTQAAPLARRYAALNVRERRLVNGAAVVVVLALVYTVLVEPAWTTVQRMQEQLPTLRTQQAMVDSLVTQAQALRRNGGTHNEAAPTAADLADSLKRAGLPPDTWSAVPDGDDAGSGGVGSDGGAGGDGGGGGGGRSVGGGVGGARGAGSATWRVQLINAPSDVLMHWLDTVPADLRLQVTQAQLQRAASEYGRPIPGRVNGTVILSVPTPTPAQARGR